MKGQQYTYRLKIIRWIDGDTLVGDLDLGFGVILAERTLRLYGVNTPEKRPRWSAYASDPKHPTADEVRSREAEIKAAEAALKFCEDKCPLGSYVTVRSHKDETGKFGRYLVEVFPPDSDRSLNDQLVESGHAKQYLL